METFNDSKSDLGEGEETITKLFTVLVSVPTSKGSDLRMTQYFQDLGLFGYTDLSHLANNIHERKLVFPSACANKIYRFVKIPLFAVTQGMLNNFVMLVYV